MRIPSATYRIQFCPDFGFQAARDIVPYLRRLGISDLYASPVFLPRKGSAHGYDVVDPNRLNPELGTDTHFEALHQSLERCEMGWIQDIVPNHMAFDPQNVMLMDVLENGKRSPYFHFFDIDWDHPYESIRGRVLAPFLGRPYGEVLEDGELSLKFGPEGFSVTYYDWAFPLRPDSYGPVLTHRLKELKQRLGRHHPDYINVLGLLYVLQTLGSGEETDEHHDQVAFIKGMLWDLYTRNRDIRSFVDRNIEIFNGRKGVSESFTLLDVLLYDQFYRLSFWKVATEEINYRRFFNINELICLRVEQPQVLPRTHELVFDLLRSGHITGLRIDHIDGLYDPAGYLEIIRQHVPDAYVAVEKILDLEEDLPRTWPVQGTTGYDFLNYVNGLFCAGKNEKAIDRIYRDFTGLKTPYDELVVEKKRVIIQKHMGGDVDNLALLLKAASSKDRYGRDITLYGLRRGLVAVLAGFPVYRTYLSGSGSSRTDEHHIRAAVTWSAGRHPELAKELHFIERFLLGGSNGVAAEEDRADRTRFVMRFQQFTGPLMAKGFEDTTLYVYNRLLSLNEVGGDPGRFGVSAAEFHRFLQDRGYHWPHSLNATGTHDMKRGEDVRARIQVLSELPGEWERCLKLWARINRKQKKKVAGKPVPDRNDEYFLYQTLLGAYPFREDEYGDFVDRIKAYLVKAVREAKVHTAWLKPDAQYEEGFLSFVDRILERKRDNPFLSEFRAFQTKIAHLGMGNSLSQTLIKITSPGVPDFYQGAELWDLSLVDPDNRRPVDYAARMAMLAEIREGLREPEGLIAQLLASPQDGRIKLFLTHRALRSREQHRDLFAHGDYLPVAVEGQERDHIVAFARVRGAQWALTIAPRCTAHLLRKGQLTVDRHLWGDTRLVLPETLQGTSCRDVFTGRRVTTSGLLHVDEALDGFPVSLMVKEKSP